MEKQTPFQRRRWTGLFGEYWFLSELAKREINAQRLNENQTGADIITQDNILIEVKTSQAHMIKEDTEHKTCRCWSFNSIRKETKRVPDVLVCIALKEGDEFKIEHLWIIPTDSPDMKGMGSYKNNFSIKDTKWQLKNYKGGYQEPSVKWIEKYKNNWDILI
jgi:hypothetical protein